MHPSISRWFLTKKNPWFDSESGKHLARSELSLLALLEPDLICTAVTCTLCPSTSISLSTNTEVSGYSLSNGSIKSRAVPFTEMVLVVKKFLNTLLKCLSVSDKMLGLMLSSFSIVTNVPVPSSKSHRSTADSSAWVNCSTSGISQLSLIVSRSSTILLTTPSAPLLTTEIFLPIDN